jgi:MFS family permease
MFLLSFVSLSMFLMTMPSVALWGPSFLVRAFSVSPIESGYMVGLASLIGGGTGALVLPSIIRHYARNHRTDAFSTLVLGTMVLALVCAIVAGFGGSLWIALAGIGGFMFFAGGAATMPTLIVQLFAPLQLCGRISAVAMFMIYLFGFGLAPVLVPMLASYCAGEPAALGYAIAVLALLSSLIAIPVFAMIRPAFRRAEEAVFAYEVEAEAHA